VRRESCSSRGSSSIVVVVVVVVVVVAVAAVVVVVVVVVLVGVLVVVNRNGPTMLKNLSLIMRHPRMNCDLVWFPMEMGEALIRGMVSWR